MYYWNDLTCKFTHFILCQILIIVIFRFFNLESRIISSAAAGKESLPYSVGRPNQPFVGPNSLIGHEIENQGESREQRRYLRAEFHFSS